MAYFLRKDTGTKIGAGYGKLKLSDAVGGVWQRVWKILRTSYYPDAPLLPAAELRMYLCTVAVCIFLIGDILYRCLAE